LRHWVSIPTLAAVLFIGSGQPVVGVGSDDTKKGLAFGLLEGMSLETAKTQAQAWLKSVGKTDAATAQRFEALWGQTSRPVLDLVSDTFALGNPEAAKLLAAARDPLTPAPTALPDLIKDAKQPAFFRANLALSWARHLSNRRVHEEALAALKTIKAEQVVEPASYLFHRSVCEHALLQKPEATKTISKLLDDSVNAPERYRTLAALMLLDMETWTRADVSRKLADIGRKMGNVERRLDLARGGPETQKIQKEVVARLDELIKELENKAKGS